MKKIITFLFAFGILFSNNIVALEHRIVIHGLTKHLHDTDKFSGEEFNEKNYGIGYKITGYDEEDKDIGQFYLTASVSAIKDSFYNPFYFGSVGVEYRFNDIPLSFSLDAMGGSKIIYSYNTADGGETYTNTGYYYSPIFGAMPGLALHLGDFSINYNFSPSIQFYNMYIEGFHYLYLTYKFN
jgi:hypothetical protein